MSREKGLRHGTPYEMISELFDRVEKLEAAAADPLAAQMEADQRAAEEELIRLQSEEGAATNGDPTVV